MLLGKTNNEKHPDSGETPLSILKFMKPLIDILTAISLQVAGYTLFVLFYYLRKNTWNGYLIKAKIITSVLIMIIIGVLLALVPEVGNSIKLITGLDINIESSLTGFLTIGFTLSGIAGSELSVKQRKQNENIEP